MRHFLILTVKNPDRIAKSCNYHGIVISYFTVFFFHLLGIDLQHFLQSDRIPFLLCKRFKFLRLLRIYKADHMVRHLRLFKNHVQRIYHCNHIVCAARYKRSCQYNKNEQDQIHCLFPF